MKSVIRVKNKNELEQKIEDKITEGYSLKSESNNAAYLVKRNYGSGIGHLVVFILFGWWTLLFANLIYAVYSAYFKANELHLKTRKN